MSLRLPLLCLVFLCVGSVSLGAQAAGSADYSQGGELQPALGMTQTFGRWNSVIRLGYNPANAPAEFANPEDMRALLREAAERWEHISGIRFEVLQAADYPDDNASVTKDGIVQIAWVGDSGNFAGSTRVSFGAFDSSLGYYPYTDGYIALNRVEFAKRLELNWGPLSTLSHEIGHLIGLGHSDIPQSLMYANPYNRRGLPAEDDIRIAQVLYGPPAQAVNAARPLPEWQFPVIPAASETLTRYLLKKNQHSASPDGPIVMLSTDPFKQVRTIDASSPADASLGLLMPIGDFDNADIIDLPVSMVLLDPGGYADAIYSTRLECAARHACVTGFYADAVKVFRNTPGTWTLKLIANLETEARLLYSTSFVVADTLSVNSAPTAQVLFAPGASDNKARIRLQVFDREQDTIHARWYTTGRIAGDGGANLYYESPLGNGENSPWEEIDFLRPGQHTLFIEVNDDAERYAGTDSGKAAGPGYRTLLRVTVTLPLSGSDSVSVVSSSLLLNNDNNQHLAALLQEYQPSADWPLPYNGVAPDASLSLGLNNIGQMNKEATRIASCVDMRLNGAPRAINGILQFDIDFTVNDVVNGVIVVRQTRPFNGSHVLAQDERLPDCSGRFDFFTGVYSDILQFGEQVFRVNFVLEDSVTARFRLRDFQRLSP